MWSFPKGRRAKEDGGKAIPERTKKKSDFIQWQKYRNAKRTDGNFPRDLTWDFVFVILEIPGSAKQREMGEEERVNNTYFIPFVFSGSTPSFFCSKSMARRHSAVHFLSLSWGDNN